MPPPTRLAEQRCPSLTMGDTTQRCRRLEQLLPRALGWDTSGFKNNSPQLSAAHIPFPGDCIKSWGPSDTLGYYTAVTRTKYSCSWLDGSQSHNSEQKPDASISSLFKGSSTLRKTKLYCKELFGCEVRQ